MVDMLKLLNNKKTPIGLDMGHASIKMIQMDQADGQLTVHAADSVQFDPDLEGDQRREFIVKTIREMVEKGNFCGRDVVVSISNRDLKLKNLRVDSIEEEELQTLIHDEVAAQLGLDPEKDEIRYLVAGKVHHSGELKNEVIFMGADSDTIQEYINLLTEAGVSPVGIDPVSHALQRSFVRSLRRQSDQTQVNFYIDIGSAYTTVLIGSNQQIHFIKQIPIGGDRFNTEIASELDITIGEAATLRLKIQQGDTESVNASTKHAVTDAMIQSIEELAHEVSLCSRYYAVTFRGKRPERVILAGGEAYEKALSIALKKELNMEMEIASPLKGLDISRTGTVLDDQSPLCEWSVAIGLSLKGCDFTQYRQDNHERN
jgi:type IV pilus assembly protein PilM